MHELLALDGLSTLLRLGGGGTVFIFTLMWLLKRGDALQRENINDLRRQRDDWRKLAETRQRRIDDLEADLARRLDTGEIPLPPPQTPGASS